MRTLSQEAQGDIVKLTGGLPWAEVVDLLLPEAFTPTSEESGFIAIAPDGGKHILLSNIGDVDKIGQPAEGWTTSGLPEGFKWYFAVPYQRDAIEDANEQRGVVNTRISLGDTGGVIKSIVDRCDGLVGIHVDIAAVLIDQDNPAASDGTLICHQPDVVYSFNIGSTTFDGISLSCVLTVDSPIEWKFPPRAMLKNVCHFAFKGTECGFNGTAYLPLSISRTGTYGVRSFADNGFLLSRGYIEQMSSTGGILTTPILTPGTYSAISSGWANDFYSVLSGNVVYWDGLAPSNISFAGEMESSYFPDISRRLSSGGDGYGYCITATNVPRYLYYLEGDAKTNTNIGNFPIAVHSAEPFEAFAIKAASSGDSSGSLYILAGATPTLVDDTLAWDWIRHVGAGECIGRAGGKLYRVSTSSGVTITEILDGDSASLPAASLSFTGRHDGKGGNVIRLDVPDGDDATGTIYTLSGAVATPVLEGYNWLALELSDWLNWTSAYGFAVADEGIYRISITSGVWSKVYFAPPATGLVYGLSIIDESSLYVLAGDNVYLCTLRDYESCNHTLADCKDRGNQSRFGGFPGIGTGGLTR